MKKSISPFLRLQVCLLLATSIAFAACKDKDKDPDAVTPTTPCNQQNSLIEQHRVVSFPDTASNTTTSNYLYDAQQQLIKLVDLNSGFQTNITYADGGRTIISTHDQPSGNALRRVFEFDENGNLTQRRIYPLPDSNYVNVADFYYDAAGYLKLIRSSAMNEMQNYYPHVYDSSVYEWVGDNVMSITSHNVQSGGLWKTQTFDYYSELGAWPFAEMTMESSIAPHSANHFASGRKT